MPNMHVDNDCQRFIRQGRARREGDQGNSGTQIVNETESDSEKGGCLAFNKLMCMLPTLDRELAAVLSKKLSEQFNFEFTDLSDAWNN